MAKRTTIQLSDNSQTEESYTYDAAGNIVGDGSDCGFVYDTNNRLTSYDGNAVEYDMDGNMTSVVLEDETTDMTYDSANRLTSAGANHYTYDAEDVRIRNLCGDETTTYTYNTNVKLSQLLMKATGGVVTKYVYGLGLIGEECGGAFKTYHFDNRGSTVAITDASGKVTDAFQYDTYGKMIAHIGDSDVIFGYNGRDGVVTDKNGLIYMRARYYSPVLRRFVNADVIAGKISNAITLNRYAYANGNPVSNIDPFGLAANRGEPYIAAQMSPWGNPNTHVVFKETYWKERWFGPDGRAVKDRHWTDHSTPNIHTDPHDQNWNWSDPEHPYLENPYPSPNPPAAPPPEGSEEWNPNKSDPNKSDPNKSDPNKSDKPQNTQYDPPKSSPTVGEVLLGTVIVIGAGAAIGYIAANDTTIIGIADDGLILPLLRALEKGWGLVFGAA